MIFHHMFEIFRLFPVPVQVGSSLAFRWEAPVSKGTRPVIVNQILATS